MTKLCMTLKIVGIMKPNEESSNQTSGEIGYTTELTEYVITETRKSKIAQEQLENKEKSILTNMPLQHYQHMKLVNYN